MSQSIARATPSAHQLEVVYRPTSALKPDPRNARTHPKRQIDQLVQSITEFGFTNPLLVDGAASPGTGAEIEARAEAFRAGSPIASAEWCDAVNANS